MLRIKYPKFLNCIKYIPKGSDICIIEAIESLAYGNSESKYLSTVLEQNGNEYVYYYLEKNDKGVLEIEIKSDYEKNMILFFGILKKLLICILKNAYLVAYF